jgi:MFS family permease
MWELYALWVWMAAFFVAAPREGSGAPPSMTATGALAFVAIGVAGLVGSVVAGRVADRFGRTATASGAMLASAGCCLVSPVAFTASAPVLVAVLVLWGATAVADSAQFSAAVTELAEPRYAGSILTMQLALGFVLTMLSIRLVPLAADALGWRYALLPLAPGPLLGTFAMLRLRRTPAARRLAGGNR